MTTQKRKLEDYFEFINAANAYLPSLSGDNKLKYAINRVVSANDRVRKDYLEAVEDLKIDYASVDEKGNLELKSDGKEYQYTKDARKALNKAIKALLAEDTDVKVYFATELPEDYEKAFDRFFSGFVIDPATVKEEEEVETV